MLGYFVVAKAELEVTHGRLQDAHVSLAEDQRTILIYIGWNGDNTKVMSFEMPEVVKDFDAQRWVDFLTQPATEQSEWLVDYRGRLQ